MYLPNHKLIFTNEQRGTLITGLPACSKITTESSSWTSNNFVFIFLAYTTHSMSHFAKVDTVKFYYYNDQVSVYTWYTVAIWVRNEMGADMIRKGQH